MNVRLITLSSFQSSQSAFERMINNNLIRWSSLMWPHAQVKIMFCLKSGAPTSAAEWSTTKIPGPRSGCARPAAAGGCSPRPDVPPG